MVSRLALLFVGTLGWSMEREVTTVDAAIVTFYRNQTMIGSVGFDETDGMLLKVTDPLVLSLSFSLTVNSGNADLDVVTLVYQQQVAWSSHNPGSDFIQISDKDKNLAKDKKGLMRHFVAGVKGKSDVQAAYKLEVVAEYTSAWDRASDTSLESHISALGGTPFVSISPYSGQILTQFYKKSDETFSYWGYLLAIGTVLAIGGIALKRFYSKTEENSLGDSLIH